MTQFSIKDLQEKDKDIHAFLEFVDEKSIQEQIAKSQERILAGNPLSPIDGKTIAIKENFCWTQGTTNAASEILEDFKAPYTATAVQKIIDAGGIIVGKTNMDEFAFGSSTENSAYGPTKNPHDLDRVPGGSSGGSAAAVASGMVELAIGTDTGGSIRQPAAFCGVVGFKPTYGAVSRYGVIAYGSSLDTIGTFGKTVKEARELFEVMAGKDVKDATSIDIENSKFETLNSKQAPHSKLKTQNLKIGLPKEFFAEGLDPRIKNAIDGVVEKIKSQGAEVVEISLPSLPYALACYYIIAFVEASSNLARYDGVRYGFSIENSKSKVTSRLERRDPSASLGMTKEGVGMTLLDIYQKSRAMGFGEEVKRRIMLGTYVSSAGYADKYYHQAQIVRQEIKKEFDDAFSKVDCIFAPVTPTLPFKFSENTDDPVKMYLEDVYTVPINVAGIPAISIPIETAQEGDKKLPIGMQILGKQRDDYNIFNIAQNIEDLISKS